MVYVNDFLEFRIKEIFEVLHLIVIRMTAEIFQIIDNA